MSKGHSSPPRSPPGIDGYQREEMERWSLYKSIEFTKRATRRPEIDKQVRPVTARVCIRRGYLNDPGCGPPCYLAFGQHRQRRNTPPPLYRRLPPRPDGID